MISCLKRLLVLLVLLHQLEALGCRFNVRDVGFVDLGSEPYRLYLFVGDAMPAAERESLQSIAVATFYDTNVKPELVALGQARQTAVKGFVPSGFTGQTPMAVLVSPDQKRTLGAIGQEGAASSTDSLGCTGVTGGLASSKHHLEASIRLLWRCAYHRRK